MAHSTDDESADSASDCEPGRSSGASRADEPGKRELIITIDGPAGTGKSTIARLLANRLGLAFLDTGAMYRAAALLALREGVSLDDGAGVAALIERARLRFDWSHDPPLVIVYDGEDVSARLRDTDVTAAVSAVAGLSEARAVLVEAQRRIRDDHPRLVTEGRDQGSLVFPRARIKFYLDASAEVRAQRRFEQIRDAGGDPGDLDSIKSAIVRRDQADHSRAVGPLVVPENAIVIDTSSMEIDEVVNELEGHVRRAIADDAAARDRRDRGKRA